MDKESFNQEMPLKPRVYVETTIPSYLTAWRSRDIVIAGNQETTREWWDRREDFELFISEFVVEEVSGGAPEAAERRMDYLLTGNCAHIANPAFRSRIEAVIRSFGYELPIICTPLELLEI